ncbi:amino acid ABC transporter substrate-binding protein [Azospirillum canadense]|uniref:amino acid ABC transporter substrate-binding protein n=1 Tax=Azospirillum canadense TaxID=403962 RepID=UPI0022265ACA|nr:amino acid ABC transporter substrate-binding protein [Azospirillum canadense]MCW2238185.1 general L-amino acid transport system substrate-binding protein [Azospirillum canadense]
MRLVRALAGMVLGVAVLELAVLGALPGRPARADTLAAVQEAGVLRCGVTSRGSGLSILDESGRWRGFFADMCRSLAAAVTGSADRVEFVEANAENRFAILRNGEVDVVMEGTTWTLQRDAAFGVDFPTVYLFDGQGFIAHRSLGVAHLDDLAKTTTSVCAIEQTTSLRNLEDWMARSGARLTLKRVRSDEGATSAFFNHHCDLFSSDRMSLYAQRRLMAPDSNDYVILPETISKEPLGPMVRTGEKRWFDIVRWVFLATVLAEEKGVTAANAAAVKEDTVDVEVRKLLGATPGLGWGLGLDDGWGLRVITQVGNYGEIFDRHLGAGSPLGIERGLNALWSKGGLMFAPPLGG